MPFGIGPVTSTICQETWEECKPDFSNRRTDLGHGCWSWGGPWPGSWAFLSHSIKATRGKSNKFIPAKGSEVVLYLPSYNFQEVLMAQRPSERHSYICPRLFCKGPILVTNFSRPQSTSSPAGREIQWEIFPFVPISILKLSYIPLHYLPTIVMDQSCLFRDLAGDMPNHDSRGRSTDLNLGWSSSGTQLQAVWAMVRGRKIHSWNWNQKEEWTIFIKDMFQSKLVTRNQEGPYIVIKWAIYQEDITIASVYTPNIRAPK